VPFHIFGSYHRATRNDQRLAQSSLNALECGVSIGAVDNGVKPSLERNRLRRDID